MGDCGRLELRGLVPPMVMIRVRKAADALEPGETMEIAASEIPEADGFDAISDLLRLAEALGCELLHCEGTSRAFTLTIRKRAI